MNDHHSDPSASKPDDASSRPVPPLSDSESAASGAEPTPQQPSAAATADAHQTSTEADSALAAAGGDVSPSATAGEPHVGAGADADRSAAASAEPQAGATSDSSAEPGAGESLAPHWPEPSQAAAPEPATLATPSPAGFDAGAASAPAEPGAGDGQPSAPPPGLTPRSGAVEPSLGTAENKPPQTPTGTEPATLAAASGPAAGPRPPQGPGQRPPMPPGLTPPPPGAPPTSSFAAPGAPPPAGPPTGPIPVGGPAGQPFGGPAMAPPKKKSKAPALVAAALVLALGAGTAGGVAGFALAGLGGGGDSSSPSEQVANGDTISDIAKKVQPSVVSIATENAGGSGVVYDDKGHIITNNHVAETASGGKLEVTFADGTTSQASVVGTDPAGDLAVIKVDDVDNLTPIKLGDSGALDVGDTVLAIGSPLGLDGSVTSGIVSALNRTVQAGGGEQGGNATTLNGLIQTDAAINPGNSGGALVNGKGELIGINTVIATTGSSEGSVGLGFAIPSDTVSSTVDQLIDGGDIEHGYLGVSVVDNVEGSEGAVVNKVEDGSPADKAGLKRGDVITSIDGEKVGGASDVGAVVQGAKPGTKVDIEYTRSGKSDSTSAELGSTSGD
ncbi:trypsin-like peptidase domain-containing protein [Stackebrandtia nassauensis]|uniref:PDZ/DHR/GLGF domain protein n=1 Tax=Stackebrandtia nassauensis (strain DSM 44728 / CIP 108903 / NRRL B-16338 / NBRC 102104 / LLR-40K-21) TaxID=446470 RepID=D3QAY1_STANL|nr:trypsin-like peptidase domain-containing protein [Stackebrandtia nassauensis]ADD44777.1 PDZ/DHR/GLGF domain protein [Stackebrandtia nassauensis DSM 44728]